MTSVSAGHIILTLTQPVGSGRPQRKSKQGPLHQESVDLPTEPPLPLHERERERDRERVLGIERIKETEKERVRQSERAKERQRDREIERQTEIGGKR